MTGSIIVKNANVIPMTEDEKIYRGSIRIDDGVITYAGPENEQDETDCYVIDAAGKTLMPGLINTHTHAAMAMFRNYGNDLPLQRWLNEKIFPAERKNTENSVYWGTMLGILEMIRTGTTCFADHYFFMDQVAKAVAETGIRANLSHALIFFEDTFDAKTDPGLTATRELFNTWNGAADGRITVNVGPHSVYLCSRDYLRAAIELAMELETGLHIHMCETQKEESECYRKYCCFPVEHLRRLGGFQVPVIAAHSVHMSEEDMEIYAEYGVTAANNPKSNLKLASGIAQVPKMLSKGINVSLGTDGAASNNNLDMLEETKFAVLIYKGAFKDSMAVKAIEALKMATVNGAKALRLNAGTIEVGKKADLILVDTNRFNYQPQNDLIAAMAYSSNSRDIHTVIVDGKILMENFELKTIDEERVIYEVSREAQRIFG